MGKGNLVYYFLFMYTSNEQQQQTGYQFEEQRGAYKKGDVKLLQEPAKTTFSGK